MPEREYQFWVYILSNRSHIIYIGVTNNLRRRVIEHRKQTSGTFVARYKDTRLVYFERYQYVDNAIARDKELNLSPASGVVHLNTVDEHPLLQAMDRSFRPSFG